MTFVGFISICIWFTGLLVTERHPRLREQYHKKECKGADSMQGAGTGVMKNVRTHLITIPLILFSLVSRVRVELISRFSRLFSYRIEFVFLSERGNWNWFYEIVSMWTLIKEKMSNEWPTKKNNRFLSMAGPRSTFMYMLVSTWTDPRANYAYVTFWLSFPVSRFVWKLQKCTACGSPLGLNVFVYSSPEVERRFISVPP